MVQGGRSSLSVSVSVLLVSRIGLWRKVGMSQARALSSDDVRGLRAELAAGSTPTVWFTSSAVGVTAGRSGKVMSLGDTTEGDFIQVKPAGSQDVLSFSAAEVTADKPPRKKKSSATEPGTGTASARPSATGTRTKGSGATASDAETSRSGTTWGVRSESSVPARGAANGNNARASGAAQGSAKPTETTAAASRRKPRVQAGAVITLTSGSDGQWAVDVTTGKKRVLKSAPVSPSAVAQAARALHDEVADAVEPLLEAARHQQRARVEQLQQELAEAERMLSDLTD